ncbi:TetR/AcrR family transcriptional regulator [Lacticaseibacillus saniviri]
MTEHIETLFEQFLQASDMPQKQQAVLTASLTLFAEKGFEATSTRDIATAANVAEGTVYRQFKTKAQILQAILQPFTEHVFPKAMNEFLQVVTQQQKMPFEQFLRLILRDRITFLLQNHNSAKVFLGELFKRPDMVQQMQALFVTRAQPIIADVIAQYQRARQLVDWPAERIMRYIVGTVLSYILPVLLTNHTAKAIDDVVNESAEFLLRGLAPTD